jgi:2-methylcitrate dehydratase PrpD
VHAPTTELAAFAASLRDEQLPGDVKRTLGELFLDYLRVASIGARMPWSEWARQYVDHLGGSGKAAVLFTRARTDPVRAAFLNATYSGSIDADDTHVGSMLHPGSVVFSAALALAWEVDAAGRDFLTAVAAGYEAMIRIGLSIQPSHFNRGFQSTATCGGFGAATAAARLAFQGDKRAERRIAETIGIVASFSGGLTQFYESGSTVKRIHAARAAENGVAAALLVANGFSGPTDILEGSNGFAREVTVKGHACSARVQAGVEGVLHLCRAHAIKPNEIVEIHVGVPSIVVGRLTIPRPVDVQAAQMSLPFSVALVAAKAAEAGDGFALDVGDYETALVDPKVAAIERCVRCEIDPQVEAATTAQSVPARITIKLASGLEHGTFVAAPKGSPSRPFTHEDHIARFRRELTRRLPERNCDRLIEIAEDLTALDRVGRIADLVS